MHAAGTAGRHYTARIVEVKTPEHVVRIVRLVLRDYGIQPTTTSVATVDDGWNVTVGWGPTRVKHIHLEPGPPSLLRAQLIRQLGV